MELAEGREVRGEFVSSKGVNLGRGRFGVLRDRVIRRGLQVETGLWCRVFNEVHTDRVTFVRYYSL